MTMSLSLETKKVSEEMVEDNKEVAEEIEGEVMEEEEDIEVAHQCKKMEEGQVLVTTEAATSTIEETVATKDKDLWIIIMAHLIE